MDTFKMTMDGREVTAREGQTILQVALAHGIDIPHLCYDPRLSPTGACRLCVVEIEGEGDLQTSCTRLAEPGMVVHSESEPVVSSRKSTLELLLSEHDVSCTTCDADGDCLLQDYAYRYEVDEERFAKLPTAQREEGYTVGHEGIVYDPSKCVRCQRCVKICAEVEMAEALTFKGRSLDVEVSTPFDLPLNDSTCEICGLCVSTCPTGALWERAAKGQGRAKDLQKVRTTCTYCGVGCQLDLNVNPETNRIVRITTDTDSIINGGNTCVKGRFGFKFVHSPERLTTPLIREDGELREASWEEALEYAGTRLAEIRDTYGPDGLAFLSSCRCTNEENFLMQKIARTAGRTNNVDQCATTCHAPTVAGLASAFGSGAMTNSIGEVKDIDTIFIIGSNPTDAHPIIGLEMKKALRKGAKLVVCDPRKTWMARRADVHIQHIPGTDNYLINAMMNYIIEQGWHDQEFLETRCENFEPFRENLRDYSVEDAAETCGVEAEDIRRAAELYAKGEPSAIFYTLGITEHTCGTENVQNLANLSMICGQIGKASSGVNPLRGQNNVQGGCDMGAIHTVFPGYQKVADEAVRAKFGEAWGVEIPTNVGGRVTDFIEWAGEGKLKAFYVMGEDPVLSEPNQAKVIQSLQKLEFLVVQE
ncbi:MAG: molybdopterin-dependent oxidoreductase, partial [Candidatus Brocadiia bacterium]